MAGEKDPKIAELANFIEQHIDMDSVKTIAEILKRLIYQRSRRSSSMLKSGSLMTAHSVSITRMHLMP